MKIMFALVAFGLSFSFPAIADVGDAPAFIGSAQDVAALVAAIKINTPVAAKATVTCTDVIVIHTGGTMGSATAGQCTFAGSTVLECVNNMVGNTGMMSQPQPGITLESSLRELIDSQCTGG